MNKGMDTDQVRTFGNNLQNNLRGQVESLLQQITSTTQGLNWIGPDADRFKGERLGELTSKFQQLMTSMQDIGLIAVRNADEQDTAAAAL